ncbi:MAG: TetR family transcriptional regulator [Sporolactobacillus sp.]
MKNDRRFCRTEERVTAAFAELLNEKGFSQLTVGDIAARADINRATFYQHYNDKYELLHACECRLLAAADERIRPMLTVDVRALYRSGALFPGSVELLRYYKAHARLILGLLENGEPFSFRTQMMNSGEAHLRELLDRQFAGYATYPLRYLAAYILSAHFSVVIEWLKNGAVESEGEIAALISRLTLHGALAAPGLFD